MILYSNRCKTCSKCYDLQTIVQRFLYPTFKGSNVEMKHYFNEEGIRCNILDLRKTNF